MRLSCIACALLLLICGVTFADESEFLRTLADEEQALSLLARRIKETPEKVEVRVGFPELNSAPLSMQSYKCLPPSLLGIGQQSQAVSLCNDDGEHFAMLWFKNGQRFSYGLPLTLKPAAWGGQLVPTQDWELLGRREPWVSNIAHIRLDQLESLNLFWAAMRARAERGFPSMMKGAPLRWPEGVQALHWDGRVMVKNGSLVGIKRWQKWIKKQEWPNDVQGVAGVKINGNWTKSNSTQPGELLDTLELGKILYGVVIIEGLPSSENIALWSSGRKLVLAPFGEVRAHE